MLVLDQLQYGCLLEHFLRDRGVDGWVGRWVRTPFYFFSSLFFFFRMKRLYFFIARRAPVSTFFISFILE